MYCIVYVDILNQLLMLKTVTFLQCVKVKVNSVAAAGETAETGSIERTERIRNRLAPLNNSGLKLLKKTAATN